MQLKPKQTEPTEFPAELVESCTNSFKQIRVAAMRDEPFYGMISAGLGIQVGDFFNGEEVDTLATDGSYIYINPIYFMSKEIGARKTTILHEIMHVSNGHHLRRNGRDPYWWNLACDYAINIILLDSGQALCNGWACDEKYRGWSAERIYADIYPGDQPPPPKPPPGKDPPPPGGKTRKGGDGPDEGDPGKGEPVKGKPGKGDRPKPNGKIWDGKNDDGSDLTTEEKAKRFKDLAKNIEHARSAERSAGKSGSVSEQRAMDAIVSPETSWRAKLDQLWSDVGQKSNETWRKFDRRALMCGMYLPDRDRRAINHIVMGFDISSSVGRDEQRVFMDQIEQLRTQTPCKLITIVPFNSTVQQQQIVEVEQHEDLPKKLNVGGGTRFGPVFNWVRRLDKVPDCVIMFTDLGSNDYGEQPDCRVIWASSMPVYDPTPDERYTNRPPFGDVIEVEVD